MKDFLIDVGVPFLGLAFFYVLVWFGGNVWGKDRDVADQYEVETYRDRWDQNDGG